MDTVQLIAQVGFPITAYLLLYLDLKKIIIQNTEALERVLDKLN